MTNLVTKIEAFKAKGAAYIVEARELAFECFQHVQTHQDWNMFTLFVEALNSEGYREAFMNWAQTYSPTYFYFKGDAWKAVKNKLETAPQWQENLAKATPFDTFERKAEPKVLDLDLIKARILSMLKGIDKKLIAARKGQEDIVKSDDIAAIENLARRLKETLTAEEQAEGLGNVSVKDQAEDIAKDAKKATSKAKSQTFRGALSDANVATH